MLYLKTIKKLWAARENVFMYGTYIYVCKISLFLNIQQCFDYFVKY